MVIYEVSLMIGAPVYDNYLAWLALHVKEILCFDGFVRAEIGLVEYQADDEFRGVRVSYYVNSRDDLEKYLTNHAAHMRAQALERFGDQFSAERRIIHTVMPVESSLV